MAESILFGALANILAKLTWLAGQKIGLIFWQRSELDELRKTLDIVKAVILDAEEKQESNLVMTTIAQHATPSPFLPKKKIRGLMTCSPTPFQGILEMQLSVNEGKQHLPSSGLSDWENSLELSWLENPLASFKINFNSSILAILGEDFWDTVLGFAICYIWVLQSVKEFSIKERSQLRERCKKQTRIQWPHIDLILTIYIDGQQFNDDHSI
ncbi:Uncharacterized protein TCM_031038 [Theobroma cacao]|uniref:Uncharacterized protein n=1 Tax=Theobroma cacao TaxID=3641 RepID=A0A061FDF9_THECC|nr:Uncharacterized protein TCM_031038 [Theobroma cacao]